jgi:cytochrome P450/NADPH-cytochrome P450 reductase
VPDGPATPLLVLYGTNTGSCEAFAERIANEAAAQGYSAQLATLDDQVGSLPTEGAVVIVTASYEGQPPDNARQFAAWLDNLKAGDLQGVRYAVFGCGNRQWARTYQAVPKRFDAALEAAGATRLRERGETDAGGDFFGAFDEWYAGLWRDFGQALGKTVQTAPGGTALEVEVVKDARASLLRLADLQYGEVVENRELVDMSSPLGRSKRHIDIKLPEGMSYRAGDYLAVLPHNPIGVTMRALKRFNLASDSQIVIRKPEGSVTSLPVDLPVNASEVLFHYVELAQPVTRGQVAQLAALTYQRDLLPRRVSLLELLERYPACRLGFAGFLAMLPPTRPRQYSISSSPLWNESRCTLTVAVVDAPALSGQGRFHGMASTFLANAAPGTRVAVSVRPSNDLFHPPANPELPMILVCAGTGLAPFRGFLQERARQAQSGRSVGRSLLFFGCDHPGVDYLYKDELAEWEAAGVVSVRPAFFKEPQGDVAFVQHRLWQDRADVAALFKQGATVYVCGDGRHMAPAVRETFVRIYQEAMGTTTEEAERWVEHMTSQHGRYVSDVFA